MMDWRVGRAGASFDHPCRQPYRRTQREQSPVVHQVRITTLPLPYHHAIPFCKELNQILTIMANFYCRLPSNAIRLRNHTSETETGEIVVLLAPKRVVYCCSPFMHSVELQRHNRKA